MDTETVVELETDFDVEGVDVWLARWVERLRDPESKQLRERLGPDSNGALCCIGHFGAMQGADMRFRGTFSVPTPLNHNQFDNAIRLNDNHGRSLPEIADWIEDGMPDLDVWLNNGQRVAA